MRAQSELMASVILITLTIILGVAGFLLANSWAFSRHSENAFITYAELASNEFLVFPISFERRGPHVFAYIGVIRVGVLQDSYRLYVSVYSAPFYTQRWWDLSQLSPGSISYNISSLQASLYGLLFTNPGEGVGADVSRLYAKYAGSWYSLRDLGAQGSIDIYGVGTLGIGDILFLNITVPSNAGYVYIVLWTGYSDMYIATPSVITVR